MQADEGNVTELADHDLAGEDLAAGQEVAADGEAVPIGEGGVRMQEWPSIAQRVLPTKPTTSWCEADSSSR